MELVAIPFFIILLILIGVGIAVGLVFCVVAAILLAAGVVSASAMIGIMRGSILAGFRVFIWQVGALAGMIAGIAVVAGVRFFLETWREGAGPWIGGALGGMAGGLLIALLIDFILRRLADWIEKQRA